MMTRRFCGFISLVLLVRLPVIADPIVGPMIGGSAFVFPVPVDASRLRPEAISKSQPYWRSRPELLKKIRDDRAVIVSVHQDTQPNKLILFTMSGVGDVNRSRNFSFRVSQKYERLPEVSDHFKKVVVDSKTNEVYIVTEAVGYEAHMILRILPAVDDRKSELQWRVMWGHFKGMTGVIAFEPDGEGKTTMSLDARFEAESLPLPKALMGFALEIITQKVAEKMRTFIEAQPAN